MLSAVQSGVGQKEETRAGHVRVTVCRMAVQPAMVIRFLPASVRVTAGKGGGIAGKIAEAGRAVALAEKRSVKEETAERVEAVEAEAAEAVGTRRKKDVERLSAVNE